MRLTAAQAALDLSPLTSDRKSREYRSLSSGVGVPGASCGAKKAAKNTPLFTPVTPVRGSKRPSLCHTSSAASSKSAGPVAIPWGSSRSLRPKCAARPTAAVPIPWGNRAPADTPKRLAPVLQYTVRGKAPSSALTPEQRALDLSRLEEDVLARSTAASRDSNFRTWTLFHLRWFGASKPTLPLEAVSIRAVAAQMKAARYRSFPNFVSAAKAMHLQGFAWAEELERCRRQCCASTQRGIGPSRQAIELPIRALATLAIGPEPLVDNGPIGPASWAVLSAFHMTRGAETACALASSLSVNCIDLTESWFLPVSKTDPTARGCLRTWGCVCLAAEVRPALRLCPYHAAVDHLALLKAKFGLSDGSLPTALPLFPNSRGDWCAKAGFVGTVRELAAMLGLSTADALGRDVVGEHAWRVSGSRYLASLDVPIPIIKLLARWGSDTVLRYIADAPLSALTQVYLDRVQMDGLAARAARAASSESLRDAVKHTVDFESDAAFDEVVPVPPAPRPLPFYQSKRTLKLHLVALPPFVDVASADATLCGWPIDTVAGRLLGSSPAGAHKCLRCGSESVWQAASAVAAHLAHESDSD